MRRIVPLLVTSLSIGYRVARRSGITISGRSVARQPMRCIKMSSTSLSYLR